jgi:hypothetical protein
MTLSLGDFNTKVGREDTFKLIIGSRSLHETGNHNGVRVVNFSMSKNLIIRHTVFLHHNAFKYIWTYDGKPLRSHLTTHR